MAPGPSACQPVNCQAPVTNNNIPMEPLKLSFGFKKPLKKPCIVPALNLDEPPEGRKELIECLEGQAIKVKGAVAEAKQPLIIPLKANERSLMERVRAAKAARQPPELRPDSELTEDQLAARLLIQEARARLAHGSAPATSPQVTILPRTEPLEGETEPTLEDYESVPISDYGLALLRGMGWQEGMPIGKSGRKGAPFRAPEVRPKGLGLGATKALRPAEKPATDQHGNQLVLAPGAYAKALAGPHKAQYCQIQGFDEDAGRVIVTMCPKGETVNINELLLVPVSKEEFSKGSKFLNNAKYEEYKEASDRKLEEARISHSMENRLREEDSHSSEEEAEEEDRRRSRKATKSKHRDRSRSRERRRDRHSRRKNKKCKQRHRRSSSSRRH